jgi:hypothetical protein
MMRPLQFTLLALAFGVATNVAAQNATVLFSDSNLIVPTPGMSTISSYSGAYLGNTGTSARSDITLVPGFSQKWVYRNGSFAQYAGFSGSNLGPNRSGAEANHVFTNLYADADLGWNNAMSYYGAAGAPGSSSNPYGIWRWDGTNQEILRFGVDNNLGPNLGANWRVGGAGVLNSQLQQLSDGATVIDTVVLRPDNVARSAVIVHRPGQGNTTCMLAGDTGAFGPNISDPLAQFGSGGARGYEPVAFDQRVLVNAGSGSTGPSGNSEGIWRICNGAPTALALTGVSTALGPGTSLTGTFNTVRSSPRAIGENGFVFLASYRASTNASLVNGFFLNRGGSNQLAVAEGVANGTLGPNYQNAVFNDFSFASFASAGLHFAMETSIQRPDNSRANGLWRVRSGLAPEPVLVEGDAFGSGVTLSRIDKWSIFANADMVAELSLSNGNYGLYLLRPNRAPQLLMAVGQSIQVPTTQGLRTATVFRYSTTGDWLGSQGPSSYDMGFDSWAGANGNVLLNVGLRLPEDTNISALLMLQASDQNLLFKDGFE